MTLADTSFLVALARVSETTHARAVSGLRQYGGRDLFVPVTILTETMTLIRARWGVESQRKYWKGVEASDLRIIAVEDQVMAQAMRIEQEYRDCGFGFVDATLLACCESLKDARVLSFDLRLSAYRPSFASALEVLP